MIRRVSQTLALALLFGDLVAVAVAWVSAYYLRFSGTIIAVEKDVPDEALMWESLPVVLILGAFAYRLAGQYKIDRLRRFREEVVAAFNGGLLLALFTMAAIFARQDDYKSRAAMGLFAVLAILFTVTIRRMVWQGVKTVRARGYNSSRAIVVGSGRMARKTVASLRQTPWLGIRPVGVVDDKPGVMPDGTDRLGVLEDLPKLVDLYRVEHVFIALPLRRYDDVRRVFDSLSQHVVEVRLVVDLPNFAGISLTTTMMDGLPIVGLRESPHFGLNVVVKRVMDFCIALVGLIFISPLFALIALLVKFTSPGPVFYRQERCGLGGDSFRMLKFRSMRVDAEAGGAAMTAKDDPRRTRFGSILRKTSLDELPQLINVLRGEMSLVGPRPERPVFIQRFKGSIPNYMARHAVKCGITGWAQVNGWRGNTSLRKRVQYDLYYIAHWNPLFDLRILVLTIWRGFFHKNAY